jgi:hypothetical protein
MWHNPDSEHNAACRCCPAGYGMAGATQCCVQTYCSTDLTHSVMRVPAGAALPGLAWLGPPSAAYGPDPEKYMYLRVAGGYAPKYVSVTQ